MRWLNARRTGRTIVTAGLAGLFGFLGLAGHGGGALAAQSEPWQLGLQTPSGPLMERVSGFHDLLMVIITLICLLVLALLLYVAFRFRAERNPTPSRRTHHTLLEVVWTAVPVLILVIIAIPSFRLLYYADVVPETEMTIKAIGRQWYWSYEYPDHENFTFDAFMVPEDELEEGQPRLLTTDQRVVLPADTNVKLQVTASDVLHSWAMPSQGVKIDAVPGRLNEAWVNFTEPGIYYGQCSEICGVNHGFMPITVEVLEPAAFADWVEEAKERFARVDDPGTLVANR